MSIPIMECNIGFSFFKKFDKAVNTFVNARDMHAFPIIRKKSRSKMTTRIYSSERSSTNPRNRKEKEACEKASLEHEESKDKPDVFLDNNPKYVDYIIKAMTPETITQEKIKLLEIHYRKNHFVPIKEIKVMASMGIFDSKLASCQPLVSALCMLVCAHKKP